MQPHVPGANRAAAAPQRRRPHSTPATWHLSLGRERQAAEQVEKGGSSRSRSGPVTATHLAPGGRERHRIDATNLCPTTAGRTASLFARLDCGASVRHRGSSRARMHEARRPAPATVGVRHRLGCSRSPRALRGFHKIETPAAVYSSSSPVAPSAIRTSPLPPRRWLWPPVAPHPAGTNCHVRWLACREADLVLWSHPGPRCFVRPPTLEPHRSSMFSSTSRMGCRGPV